MVQNEDDESPSLRPAVLGLGIAATNEAAGTCYALASARNSRRVATLVGFAPEKSSDLVFSHVIPKLHLVLATCVEPFEVFLLLIVLFTATALATAELVNVYRTRCVSTLIIFVNLCYSLRFWLKSAGKEFLLARKEFSEL